MQRFVVAENGSRRRASTALASFRPLLLPAPTGRNPHPRGKAKKVSAKQFSARKYADRIATPKHGFYTPVPTLKYARRKAKRNFGKCPVCAGPGWGAGEICMACVRSRAKTAGTGRCSCGAKRIPGAEARSGSRAWTPCERCLGAIPGSQRDVKRNKLTKKPSRRAKANRRSRGSSAKQGGRSMATTAKQRAYTSFFARMRKAGKSASAIGAAWRAKHGSSARRNKRGRPLSGKKFRPSLPKGPVSAVVRVAKRKYKKAAAARTKRKLKAKARKASKKSGKKAGKKAGTKRNRRRSSVRRNSGGRKRTRRNRRPHARRNRRRHVRRNFSVGGIISKLKSAFKLSTLKGGLAALVGAVAASGAPSLMPVAWNQGWMGLGLSLLSAAGAAVATSFFAPQFFNEVVAGGVVVVGLRLVAQFLPRALRWAPAPGVAAGYLSRGLRGIGGGVGGFALPYRSGVSGFGGGTRVRALVSAGGESFRSKM